jgi:hypothetical protein
MATPCLAIAVVQVARGVGWIQVTCGLHGRLESKIGEAATPAVNWRTRASRELPCARDAARPGRVLPADGIILR